MTVPTLAYLDLSGSPPPYPVHALPEPIYSFVRAAASSVGVPPEMVAVPLLCAAGATLGNRKAIELKRGYSQYPILWGAVVAPPGTAKTPAQQAGTGPLRELQRRAWKTYQQALERYEAELAEWDAKDRRSRGIQPRRPSPDSIMTTDATIEALAHLLNSSGGVLLVRDELVGWVAGFDAYRKGGERQAHLSMWSGESQKVDRRTRDPVFVQAPVACVYGGVQPDMLPELCNEAGRQDGFLDRFLWSMPPTTPAKWSDSEIEPELHASVVEIFHKLRWGPTSEAPVRLSSDAKRVWRRFYDENSAAAAASQGIMAGISAKMPNQVARVALVLHCLENPEDMDRPLSEQTLGGAIELCEYHRAHAHLVVSRIAARSALVSPLTHRIRQSLDAAGTSGLTRSELHGRLGGHVSADELTSGLSGLEERGLARRAHAREGDGSGRRGERWYAVPPARTNEENELMTSPEPSSSVSSFDSFVRRGKDPDADLAANGRAPSGGDAVESLPGPLPNDLDEVRL